MTFNGAVIREQGVTFAVVIVKPQIVQHQPDGNRTINALQPIFPGIPVVLMAQDSRGTPTYYGRRDLVNFLANVPLAAIPWKQYHRN
jgi:hypothetical protein